MNPYRTNETNEIQKNEYNGHLFAISRLQLSKYDTAKYECVCIHCGKSIKVAKSDNMLFNPAFRIHFKDECKKLTKIKWQYDEGSAKRTFEFLQALTKA